MKLSTLLIVLFFFSLLLTKFAWGAVPSDEIIQGAIMTAIGGNFSDGALGPRFYDISRIFPCAKQCQNIRKQFMARGRIKTIAIEGKF